MHDRVAELRGLLTELAICANSHRPDRRDAATQVRQDIDRAAAGLEREAAAIEERAERLFEGAAAVLRRDAARIREALDEVPGPPAARGKRTTKAGGPPEQT
ncbi:hypothetical protein AB0H73_00220 [Streptomyces olivoreticuli]